MAGMCCWSVFFLGFVTLHNSATLASDLVNMAGPGCSDTEALAISDSQIYTLYADRTRANQEPSQQADCSVTIQASENNRYLHYSVETLVIPDCDVSIRIYNVSLNGIDPMRILTCDDAGSLPIEGNTKHGVVRFTVHKATAEALYQFKIQVTTNLGPSTYLQDEASILFDTVVDTNSGSAGSEDPVPAGNEGQSSLNVGVVVGIAIAGVILVIALVGIAIYCCLKNRNDSMKDIEARDGHSAPSVYTSGTSQVMFAGANNHRTGGGGTYGSMEDVRSSSSTEKGDNVFSNKAYQEDGDEKRFGRQGSYRRERGHKNAAFDESDHTIEPGGHLSRRDSGRGPKYDKKKNYSRNEEYEMSKVSKVPNGILKTRSKSPNRSQSSTEGSTIDSNALVYGYSQTTHAHPNTQHIPKLERTRSRSRSRGASSHHSGGSVGRSRSGSVGKSAGKDMSKSNKNRQYTDLSHFLDKPKHERQRPRSRSGSVGRRTRSDSRTSENVPSEVSFAPSGTSSKKNTGGKRVHIQGVESDI